jgi:hypothetical protein|tara:strand:- start:912 stop:1283 length:372 start_codon:yes stop_codon:yes gene_type:complete
MAQNTGPLNIARLVALNDKYSIAEDYDRKISKTNIVCRWHERAFQDQSQRRNPIPSHVNPKALTSNSTGISGEEREMMTEIAMANRTVGILRKARLRQLLHEEALQHEAELNALGLAIHKRLT